MTEEQKNTIETQNVKMTESEMTEAFKQLNSKILLSKVMMIGGFISMPLLVLLTKKPILAIAGGVVMMVGAGMLKKNNELIKAISGEGILKKAMFEVFEDVTYDHNKCFTEAQMDAANFGYPYHTVNGTDLTEATYKGHKIAISDIDLVGRTHSSKGGSHDSSVFNGIWVIYDLGKTFNASVSAREMSGIEKSINEKGMNTGYQDFDKKFNIISDNEEEARKMLSPHFMDCVLELDKKINAKTNVAILKDGQLQIALNYSRDPFTVKGNDPNKVKVDFINQLRIITDFIDQLTA